MNKTQSKCYAIAMQVVNQAATSASAYPFFAPRHVHLSLILNCALANLPAFNSFNSSASVLMVLSKTVTHVPISSTLCASLPPVVFRLFVAAISSAGWL
jgi:hypothetical protein